MFFNIIHIRSSQRKRMLGCKPADTTMDSVKKLGAKQERPPVDKEDTSVLLVKLIYLSHPRLDLGFLINAVSQFINNLEKTILRLCSDSSHI